MFKNRKSLWPIYFFIFLLFLTPSSVCAQQKAKLPENLVSKRLEGQWKMNLALTSRISLDRQIGTIRGLKFQKDLGMLGQVPKKYTDEVKPEDFHMAGQLTVEFANGYKSSHPFILTSYKGNSLLWVFTTQSGQASMSVDTSVVNLIAGNWESDDLLFIGYNINDKPYYIIFERIIENKKDRPEVLVPPANKTTVPTVKPSPQHSSKPEKKMTPTNSW